MSVLKRITSVSFDKDNILWTLVENIFFLIFLFFSTFLNLQIFIQFC